MSNQEHTPITKLAYVDGMADTLGGLGLAQWPNKVSYDYTVEKVASLLEFDPAEEDVDLKTAGYVMDAIRKVAKETCDSAGSYDTKKVDKERQKAMKEMKEEGEKEASVAYWNLVDGAYIGAYKLAMQETPSGEAQQGMNPGQANVTGNSLSDAVAHDSLAQIENRRRPAGYAEQFPDDRSVGGEIGTQMRHPTADNIGRQNSSGGFQPARKSASMNVLHNLFGKQAQDTPSGEAQQGMNPGQANITGNSLSDAAAHDSLAQIENRRRPAGYAEQFPDDRSVGGERGEQQTHPGADNVGRSNDTPGGGFQPAGTKSAKKYRWDGTGKEKDEEDMDEEDKEAMKKDPDIEKLPPALQVKAYKKKMKANSSEKKKALFEETLHEMSQHPVFNKLSREQKIAMGKDLMYLDSSEKIACFNALNS